MDHIWKGPYKINRVGGKSNYTLTTMKRQKDQKVVERLQTKEIPCVTSRHIKSPKTQAARWASPHKPRTIQLLCSPYLTAKFLFVSLVFSMRNSELITTWLGCMFTTTDHSCTSKEDHTLLRDSPQELHPPRDQPCSLLSKTGG